MTTDTEIMDGIEEYEEAKAELWFLNAELDYALFNAEQRAVKACYPSDDEWEETVDYYELCEGVPQLQQAINDLEAYLGVL